MSSVLPPARRVWWKEPVEKIEDFDLIIFDRYTHRNVLPILYYDYIAQYVQNGGALLIAAGPEHAGDNSIAATPLSQILPAEPTSRHETCRRPSTRSRDSSARRARTRSRGTRPVHRRSGSQAGPSMISHAPRQG